MTMIGKEWQIPIFTKEEGMRRWRKVRELMAAREIDCLIIVGNTDYSRSGFADMRYVTNYINWAEDEYCVFPFNGEPTLYTHAPQHQYWAEKVSWVKEIVAPLPASRVNMKIPEITQKIKSLGLEKRTVGIVSMMTMPTYFYLGLKKELPQVNFVEAGEILQACRMIHSPAELEYVRKCGECADSGLKAMAEVAKPGVTENDLIAACENAMIKNGAEIGSFSLFNTKQWPNGWGFPLGGSYRKLQKGDIILNELTPSYGGYFTQMCKPISLGKPSDDFVEMFNIYKEMYDMAIEACCPGKVIAEIDAEVSKFAMTKRPFSHATAAFQCMGSNFGGYKPRFSGELRPGMVFTIHPWTDPPMADIKAKKYHMGHILGDSNIITEGDPECVSKLPNEIIIV